MHRPNILRGSRKRNSSSLPAKTEEKLEIEFDGDCNTLGRRNSNFLSDKIKEELEVNDNEEEPFDNDGNTSGSGERDSSFQPVKIKEEMEIPFDDDSNTSGSGERDSSFQPVKIKEELEIPFDDDSNTSGSSSQDVEEEREIDSNSESWGTRGFRETYIYVKGIPDIDLEEEEYGQVEGKIQLKDILSSEVTDYDYFNNSERKILLPRNTQNTPVSYRCKVCGKVFKSDYKLKVHEKTHSKEMNPLYLTLLNNKKCFICGKTSNLLFSFPMTGSVAGIKRNSQWVSYAECFGVNLNSLRSFRDKYLCSAHFSADQFQNWKKLKLLRTAIPTVKP